MAEYSTSTEMYERRYRTPGNTKYHEFGIEGVSRGSPRSVPMPGAATVVPALKEGKQAQKWIDDASSAPMKKPRTGPNRELTGSYTGFRVGCATEAQFDYRLSILTSAHPEFHREYK